MPKVFPAVSYKDAVKVCKKLGFYFCRHAKGSHEIWRRDSDGRQTTLSNHGKQTLKRKTVKSISDDCQVSVEEFARLLRK